MPNIGPAEIAIVLVLALVIFGPKRLPELGRSLGKGMREFKQSISGSDDGADAPAKADLKSGAPAERSDAEASDTEAEAPGSGTNAQ